MNADLLTDDLKKKRSSNERKSAQQLADNDSREKLKSIFDSRKNKQIYLQADRHVDYGTVAEVMAEIRAAGIYNIGMITLPKGKD